MCCMVLIDQVQTWEQVLAEVSIPEAFIQNLKKIDIRYVTGQHIKNMDGYIKNQNKFESKYLEKRGKAFVILCEWVLKIRELGFR